MRTEINNTDAWDNETYKNMCRPQFLLLLPAV